MHSGPLLRISLFEPVSIQFGDRPPLGERYARQKAKALFVYLFLNRGRARSKYELLADLWPEAEVGDPGRVKHTVQILRAALEGTRPTDGWRVILEAAGSYRFNTALERWCDVEEYEAEIRIARSARGASNAELARAHYQRALHLHRGAFLSSYHYDDWAADEIGRQQELYLEVLEEAALLESHVGNLQRAIELLRLATREDPLRESSYVELMRNLWLAGRRTDALRVYAHLSDVLSRQMELKPQRETRRLYEAIRQEESAAA